MSPPAKPALLVNPIHRSHQKLQAAAATFSAILTFGFNFRRVAMCFKIQRDVNGTGYCCCTNTLALLLQVYMQMLEDFGDFGRCV